MADSNSADDTGDKDATKGDHPTTATGTTGTTSATGATAATSTTATRSLAVARARDMAARAIWVICMLLAVILAIAAFTFALEANADNSLVKLVRDLADAFDLGFFDLENPVKAFGDPNGETKTALFNYGLAAVVYLVIGRLLERVLRP